MSASLPTAAEPQLETPAALHASLAPNGGPGDFPMEVSRLLGQSRSALARYVRWLTLCSLSNPPGESGGEGCAFPVPLPFGPQLLRRPLPPGGVRRRRFLECRRAMHWLNSVVAVWNFMELGCPDRVSGYGPVATHCALCSPPSWAWRLLGEVRSFG